MVERKNLSSLNSNKKRRIYGFGTLQERLLKKQKKTPFYSVSMLLELKREEKGQVQGDKSQEWG